ncbi:MAG: glycosyltransferase family 4 protein, partial [Pyrinomonadaceae bacterium]
MRIGLDALPLVPPRTGIGPYTFELGRALALAAPSHEFEFVSPFSLDTLLEPNADENLPANLNITHLKTRALRKPWWPMGLPFYVRQSALSLFHGTNYHVPLWAGCPTVNSIHDLSPLLYPATHEPRLVARARRRLPLMARSATMIVTDTESVRREVCRHLGVEPGKVAAVHIAPRRVFRSMHGEEARETRRRLGVEDEFLLYVGTIEPRKNLLTLVRALDEILRATDLRPQLVIAGKKGWLTDELFAYIGASGVGERICFTGYVSDEDLRALYSTCRVCVYPSLYEGFGLPPLEAMACGAPVVGSRIPSLVETLGSAALLCDPTDFRALAASITRLLGDADHRRRLSVAGMERAKAFTWEQTARATLKVYQEALERKGKMAARGIV